jgi:divalent metal cation (Fe/Co/Zn/Cd) transporter
MDGVDPQIIISAVAAATRVPDVAEAQARARWSGRTLTLDIDIWLDATTPLADATHIAEAVRLSALSEIEAARIVNVRPRAH